MLKLFSLIVLAVFATAYCADIQPLADHASRVQSPFDYDEFDERDSDFTCFDNEDCGGIDQGYCDNVTRTCECTDEYAGDDCDDKRKSQKIAFILEILCGFFGVKGVSYLYLGHTALGIILMILNFVGIGLMVIPIIGWTTGLIIILGAKIWWIILWAYILTDKINDADGHALHQNL